MKEVIPRFLVLNTAYTDREVYEVFGEVDTAHASFIVAHHQQYNLESYDAVVFAGGIDLNPQVYEQEPNSHCTYFDNSRDKYEVLIYRMCKGLSIPMIGICRGAQLLNIMNGGSLVQHTTNHHSDHEMITDKGQSYLVNSLHHQMMLPAEGYKLIGYTLPISDMYIGEHDVSMKDPFGIINGVEPEILWYDKTKCLCVQWHPEYLENDRPALSYFNELIQEYIIV